HPARTAGGQARRRGRPRAPAARDLLRAPRALQGRRPHAARRARRPRPRGAVEALAAELRLGQQVSFAGALPFGAPLFERLYDAHVLLAAPLAEDTPR